MNVQMMMMMKNYLESHRWWQEQADELKNIRVREKLNSRWELWYLLILKISLKSKLIIVLNDNTDFINIFHNISVVYSHKILYHFIIFSVIM